MMALRFFFFCLFFSFTCFCSFFLSTIPLCVSSFLPSFFRCSSKKEWKNISAEAHHQTCYCSAVLGLCSQIIIKRLVKKKTKKVSPAPEACNSGPKIQYVYTKKCSSTLPAHHFGQKKDPLVCRV